MVFDSALSLVSEMCKPPCIPFVFGTVGYHFDSLYILFEYFAEQILLIFSLLAVGLNSVGLFTK